MTEFWILAAAMLLAALAALLPPLLGRGRHSQAPRAQLNVAVHRDRLAEIERQKSDGELGTDQADEARREVESELLRDVQPSPGELAGRRAPRWVAGLVATGVPVLAVLMYLEVGTPAALHAPVASTPPASVPAGHDAPGKPSMDELVASLSQRLQSDPNNVQGWVMLGRSYATMERYPEARDAFTAAARLSPRDPEILTRLAEATAMANGGDLLGRPDELLREALAIRPDYAQALWLSGLAASQRLQYAEAIRYWEPLQGLVSDPSQKAMVAQYIQEARQQAGGQAVAPTTVTEPAPGVSTAEETPAVPPKGLITVQVSLAPELRARAADSDTVFIFARPAEGPRMPLAIVRRTVAELPTSVTLDDGMAMAPTMKLSSFPRVVVGARVSKSGNAAPQAGDLEGVSEPVTPVEPNPVAVRIDRQI
jgi:cytochrome c-type biogenesis protein CcmH